MCFWLDGFGVCNRKSHPSFFWFTLFFLVFSTSKAPKASDRSFFGRLLPLNHYIKDKFHSGVLVTFRAPALGFWLTSKRMAKTFFDKLLEGKPWFCQ